MSTLGERIKHIREIILKQNQASFAESLGFSRFATISDYEKNKRNPDIETLRKIAGIGSVKLEWLLTGEGPVSVHEPSGPALGVKDTGAAVYSQGFEEVKVYDMLSAKGPGDFPGTDPIDLILVPRQDSRRGPAAIRVKGDGMAPAILSGATVGIDTVDRHLVSGGLYAVWLNYEGVTVKRIFVFHDRILLKPDNPSFPETSIPTGNSGEEFIIGKVVWLYQRY
ncbi:MAG: helix-turn-helix domain-containing protein [Deltaproteobacteria bacterium]|nr:helix-turn-helix domain-containing protein [Deltaproteobacteria bacterium]